MKFDERINRSPTRPEIWMSIRFTSSPQSMLRWKQEGMLMFSVLPHNFMVIFISAAKRITILPSKFGGSSKTKIGRRRQQQTTEPCSTLFYRLIIAIHQSTHQSHLHQTAVPALRPAHQTCSVAQSKRQ